MFGASSFVFKGGTAVAVEWDDYCENVIKTFVTMAENHGGTYCGKGICNMFGCNCDGGCIEAISLVSWNYLIRWN